MLYLARRNKMASRFFRVHNKALRAEWRNLNTHRMLIVSTIVMLFIPVMYGGFFLGSIWDPYGNTKHLPVAIVNEDQPVMLNGKELHVGDDLVGQLKTSDAMGWRFVSADDAETGIHDGSYYMRLVIPKDFSKNAATITTQQPAKSTLEYTITPSRNYVASLLTTQAAEQIATTVSTSVSRAYVDALFENSTTLKEGITQAASGASELSAGSASLSSGVASYTNGVGSLLVGQQSLNSGIAGISTGSQQLSAGLVSLQGQLPADADIQQLIAATESIQAGVGQLNAAVQHPDSAIAAQQATVSADALSLQQKLVAYQTAATNASASIAALQTAIATSQTTATVNASDMLAVVGASQAVATQSATLLGNLSTLTTMLSTQQDTLKTNVATLNGGVQAFSPSAIKAFQGYTGVKQGVDALVVGANQLSGGSRSAYAGSQQILGGLTELNASTPALQNGASQLNQGSVTLASGLQSAATQLSVQPVGDATAEHIVSPVQTNEAVIGEVPNYGYALSPYVLSLGLFVGAFVFNVIYPVRRFFDKPENARSWWWAKMSVAFAVAVGQAIVLDAIMIVGLGLHPNNPGQFILLSIVTSLTYMSIITLLTLALDNVGRFLAMLLLVLQLGSAEGVFPIVLSPKFFQFVNPFVPMTYSIHAYRQAISSGLGDDVYWRNLAILVAVIVVTNLLIIGFLRLHGMRHFQHEAIDT